MKLLVCISNVPDTTTKVRFAENQTHFDESGVQWIINPWDELALTRAIDLKEDSNNPVTEVVVVNVGPANTEPTLRKCLAIGADSAIRIDAAPKDAFFTARQIASFAQKEAFDLIICGLESGDYNGSSVGGMVSEFLNIGSISSVSDIRFENGKAIVERDVATGIEYLLVNEPVVLIVQKGFANEPRIPNMRGIMMARQKPLKVIQAFEAGVLTEYVGYQLPEPKAKIKMISPDQMTELVNLLSTVAKVL